jgi:23S rRNA pseudouridine955/2504/2580 synthase
LKRNGGGGRRQRGGKRTSEPRQGGRGKKPSGAARGPRSKPSPLAGEGGKPRRGAPGEGARFKQPRHPEGRAQRASKGHSAGRLLGGPRDARPPQDDDGKPAPTFVSTGVQNVVVSPDEGGMRVDRFLEARFPGLSFSHIQRVIRKGEVRVSGKRVDPKDRLTAGVGVRLPPFKQEPPKPREDAPDDMKTRAYLKSITLYEDDDVMVLDKPYGLAVQGGSGTTRHIDGMLGAMRSRDGQRPRLVHRLDKDTSGCLLVAKSRFAAAALAKNFRHRSARKIYWALVVEVPKPKQGRISTFLAKEQMEEDSFMRIAEHGDKDAAHAVTYYAVVETAASRLAWLSLKPVTGRTHQLRAHLDHIGHPIVGDPKYFARENWQLPGGIQNRLHLLARRIVIPHPRGGTIDVTAPLPPHMTQSWNLLGFDLGRYDPIEQAPAEG